MSRPVKGSRAVHTWHEGGRQQQLRAADSDIGRVHRAAAACTAAGVVVGARGGGCSPVDAALISDHSGGGALEEGVVAAPDIHCRRTGQGNGSRDSSSRNIASAAGGRFGGRNSPAGWLSAAALSWPLAVLVVQLSASSQSATATGSPRPSPRHLCSCSWCRWWSAPPRRCTPPWPRSATLGAGPSWP